MADISLEQATGKACQVESLLRMIESYPDTLSETELSAVITLIRRLSGEVHAWFIEEQADRGRINDYIFNLSQKQD
ncbi:hypothetical protein LKU47_003341 [Salmonella enterica]|nr:hypothetical protein [Salmonella enterica]